MVRLSYGPMDEKWLPVKGFEQFYEVSNLGRTRRISRGKGARPGKVLRPGVSNNKPGYAHVLLSDGIRRVTRTNHEMVMQAFVGPRPPGYIVNHINRNKLD